MFESIQIWRLGCQNPKFAIYSDPEEDNFNNLRKSKNLSLQHRFVSYFESYYRTIIQNYYFQKERNLK
jgi:hypothetical protein